MFYLYSWGKWRLVLSLRSTVHREGSREGSGQVNVVCSFSNCGTERFDYVDPRTVSLCVFALWFVKQEEAARRFDIIL